MPRARAAPTSWESFSPWPGPPWIAREYNTAKNPLKFARRLLWQRSHFVRAGAQSRAVLRSAPCRVGRYGLIRPMFQPLELFIGLRYLRSRRWRAFVSFRTAASLLGLMLGVMALIVILSVLNGLETETRTRLLALSAQATISKAGGVADWRELERRFENSPDVVAVTPYVRLEGMLAGAGATLKPAVVRGILPSEEAAS